jgi:hypothetical protein
VYKLNCSATATTLGVGRGAGGRYKKRLGAREQKGLNATGVERIIEPKAIAIASPFTLK